MIPNWAFLGILLAIYCFLATKGQGDYIAYLLSYAIVIAMGYFFGMSRDVTGFIVSIISVIAYRFILDDLRFRRYDE